MTYEEMIDYLTSKEVIAAYGKVREIAYPFIRCSNCRSESSLSSKHYLERLSKDSLREKYDCVKKIIETKLE